MRRILGLVVVVAIVGAIIWIANLLRTPQPGPSSTRRSAPAGKRRPFPAADEDYFHDMDGGVRAARREEIKGRNMWIVWTGGNDRLWDTLW